VRKAKNDGFKPFARLQNAVYDGFKRLQGCKRPFTAVLGILHGCKSRLRRFQAFARLQNAIYDGFKHFARVRKAIYGLRQLAG